MIIRTGLEVKIKTVFYDDVGMFLPCYEYLYSMIHPTNLMQGVLNL
jgi:hypothetical protein